MLAYADLWGATKRASSFGADAGNTTFTVLIVVLSGTISSSAATNLSDLIARGEVSSISKLSGVLGVALLANGDSALTLTSSARPIRQTSENQTVLRIMASPRTDPEEETSEHVGSGAREQGALPRLVTIDIGKVNGWSASA
jgi:hypothetical protein